MKVVIAGGGTGGHLFPAIAVGAEIRRQDAVSKVLYVGATNGLEARWLPRQGLPHELLRVRGWTGKGPLTRLRAIGEFAAAVQRALTILRDAHANLVVGAGGYASAPVALAAVLLRTPLILLEQNVRPGMSNRILWRMARKVCVGFPDSAAAFPASKVVVTGNPVRYTVHPRRLAAASEPLQILVLGGSSGAHRLNIGVLKAFRIWAKGVIKLTHQTGDADVGMVQEGYRELGRSATVVPFIEDIGAALGAADLIIARSGANSVTDVAIAGRPAIFVPYPFHRDRQQELNAQVIARRGGARIVLDDEQLGANLAKTLEELTADRACLRAMGERSASLAMPHAAQKIASLCVAIARGEEHSR
jgi:UDP-N-acetylglucosamine--N-acetylmuramyl-(pentapeptide) pyrophosphoryl-undecaprenol N-acetylglucosamine transferase